MQQHEFERRQREQAEAQMLAQEQLRQQQLAYSQQAAVQQQSELERELLAMRGQYERDQIFLEQYDRVRVPSLIKILAYRLTGLASFRGSKPLKPS